MGISCSEVILTSNHDRSITFVFFNFHGRVIKELFEKEYQSGIQFSEFNYHVGLSKTSNNAESDGK